jgi:hypothetical protein
MDDKIAGRRLPAVLTTSSGAADEKRKDPQADLPGRLVAAMAAFGTARKPRCTLERRCPMSPPFVSAAIIRECQRLRLQGYPLESLAMQIGVNPEDLARLLGEPQWRAIPVDNERG